MRSSDEPSLNTATTYSLSALLAFRLLPRLYMQGQFPLVLVDEDASGEPKMGYGDTTLGVQIPVGSFRRKEAASWVLGMSVGIPTRTIRYEVDPGRQWTLSPSLRYADSFKRFLWYAQLLAPMERRPAGTAFDASPALGVGFRWTDRTTLTLGSNADIRVLTVCRTVDGSEVCPAGRATENNRPQGSVRAYGHAGLTWDLSRSWSIFAGGQLPLTRRRDIEWSASLGLEARF
jgi:hypothetical protein